MNRSRIPISEIKKEFPIGQVVDCFYARRPDGLLVDDAKMAYSWRDALEWGDVINFIEGRLKTLGEVRGLRLLSGLYGQPAERWQAELKRLAALLAQNDPQVQPPPAPTPDPEKQVFIPATSEEIAKRLDDVLGGWYQHIVMCSEQMRERDGIEHGQYTLTILEERLKKKGVSERLITALEEGRLIKAFLLAGDDENMIVNIENVFKMGYAEAISKTSEFPPRVLLPLTGVISDFWDVCDWCYEDLPDGWGAGNAYIAVGIDDEQKLIGAENAAIYCEKCVKHVFPRWYKAQELVLSYLRKEWFKKSAKEDDLCQRKVQT
jgi:hypothetical protein